jgi:hypothetical protein
MPTEQAIQYANQYRALIEGPILVDVKTHQPTPNEIDNICYLAMKYLVGWQMRQTDLMVVKSMLDGGPVPKLQAIVTEYIWDHICGEPAEPTQEDLAHVAGGIIEHFYSLPEEARESTEVT